MTDPSKSITAPLVDDDDDRSDTEGSSLQADQITSRPLETSGNEHAPPLGMPPKKRRSFRMPTVEARHTRVFTMISNGMKASDIARKTGMDVRAVYRVGERYNKELIARADHLNQLAIDGDIKARKMAKDASPVAMQRLIDELDGDEGAQHRIKAANSILNRAGVGERSAVEVTGSVEVLHGYSKAAARAEMEARILKRYGPEGAPAVMAALGFEKDTDDDE